MPKKPKLAVQVSCRMEQELTDEVAQSARVAGWGRSDSFRGAVEIVAAIRALGELRAESSSLTLGAYIGRDHTIKSGAAQALIPTISPEVKQRFEEDTGMTLEPTVPAFDFFLAWALGLPVPKRGWDSAAPHPFAREQVNG